MSSDDIAATFTPFVWDAFGQTLSYQPFEGFSYWHLTDAQLLSQCLLTQPLTWLQPAVNNSIAQTLEGNIG